MLSDPVGLDPQSWNALVASFPGAHVLQTWEWGQVKARFGWQVLPRAWRDEQGRVVAAALVLQRRLSLGRLSTGLGVLYVPKGPLLAWGDIDLRRRVLSDLVELARQQGAIFVKIDPDVRLGSGIPGTPEAQEDPLGGQVAADLRSMGFIFSAEQIQFRNTILVDLTSDLDTLLENMKQKARYNVRLAARKGVTVRVGGQADLEALYRMYAETSLRDGFAIREWAYYQELWSAFLGANMLEPLIAEVRSDVPYPEEMVAAVMIFRFAGKAWYLHGMSREAHREKMPNHLLQWEAMRRAKQAGCQVYDLWGAPDVFDESDPLWGVYRFKEGLGGQVVRYLGAWDLPLRPTFYRLYTQTLPRLLAWMRLRGKDRTRRLLG
jgi:lipid II:glycine glycyltransferase (peptidoglycan interpeptide bridge formation enzyme)